MLEEHIGKEDTIEAEEPPCSTSLIQQASSSGNCKSHSPRSFQIDEHFESAPEPLSISDDYIESSLCVHCLNACTRWAAGIDQEGMEYTHWDDIAELEASAANGCIMCTQLLQSRTNGATERAKEDIQRLGLTSVHSTLSFLQLNTKSSRDEPNVVLEYAILSTETQRGAQESDDESKLVVCTYIADLIRMDSSGSVLRDIKNSERGDVYPLRLIGAWLRDCRQNHEQCRANTVHFIPTRLISTYSTPPELFSKNDLPTAPDYATLSHCWGQEKYDTLTSRNLQDFQTRGVPDSALSKTFRDAIMVARDLNIPYIWIDSLCIMQDDKDDWVREAATMSSVYGHSTLNIAASGAPDGRFGCFSPRLEPLRTFRVPVPNSSGHEITYACFSIHYYKRSLADMPLMERGWTLQERLLPKRNLHFTKTQAFWECHQRIACEAFPNNFPTSLTYADVYLQKQPISRTMWGWIIEQYARCNLTYNADKMVAISGLARHIHLQTHDQYIAGMWREGLERQLCWKVVGAGYKGVRRAPTWSWSSLDSPIWWSYFDFYVGARETKLWVKVLDVDVQHAGDDPFGQVSSSRLRLSYTLLVHAEFGHTESMDASNEQTSLVTIAGSTARAQISLDEDWVGDEIRSAHFLPVCSGLTSARIHGLLLRKVNGAESQYFRLGRFMILEDEDCRALETVLAEAQSSLDRSEVGPRMGDKLEGIEGVIELV